MIKSVRHPNYDRSDAHSDIAILYLKQSIKFTSNIQPICIPIHEPIISKDYLNHSPFVAGWGRKHELGISSEILQELQIPILENSICSDAYKANNRARTIKQFDSATLCAGYLTGGKDSCRGDSGGPLMVPELINGKIYFYQIGIVSNGIGCARAKVPSIYTRVQMFSKWIEERVGEVI